MTDRMDPIRLLHNPTARRLWLLAEALRSGPLDRALELARSAEVFLMGCSTIADASGTGSREQEQEFIVAPMPSHEPKRGGVALSTCQRDRLLDRLAAGARKAMPLTAMAFDF